MEHESDSAGGLMTTEFISLRENMTVNEAIDLIKNVEIGKAETIYTSYVLDEVGRLVGSVTYRSLLMEPVEEKIGEVMQTKPPSVGVEDSVKEVAFEMDKYNLFAMPVVGEEDELEGIITIDDVLHVAVEAAWGKRGGL
jgi:magnesium transporter